MPLKYNGYLLAAFLFFDGSVVLVFVHEGGVDSSLAPLVLATVTVSEGSTGAGALLMFRPHTIHHALHIYLEG